MLEFRNSEMQKLKARELRKIEPSEEYLQNIKRNPIYFVLDEVWDTFNIGSMFRLADAVAAEKVYLTGNMEYPPNSRIHKAAVGTENWTPWEKRKNALEVIFELKKSGIMTVAIEQDSRAVNYYEADYKLPVALILGHESKGVKKRVLEEVDKIVELPMLGINNSFNVWGSAAVVAYEVIHQGLHR